QLLEAMLARGRHPAVVFEMVEREQQAAIERARAQAPDSPDAIAAAVDWEHSGWPAWPMYRPIFAVAVRAKLPIFAGGIDRKRAMSIAQGGATALEPELARTFSLDQPLPPEQARALRDE